MRSLIPLALALTSGIGLGILGIYANSVDPKWTIVIILAALAPSVALLIKDVRKLVLLLFILDIPLGLDISIPDWEWHQGGATGFIVSLMTIGLMIGYAFWILDKKPPLRFSGAITVPALLYLSMSALSIYQSRNLSLSLFGLFLDLQLILMYFYIFNHIRTWDDMRLVIGVMAIFLLAESVVMILQYFLGLSFQVGAITTGGYGDSTSAGVMGPRVGGTIGAPNSAATYLASMLIITFSTYLTNKLVNRKLALLAFILGIVALIATFSRSGWGSFSIGMTLLILLSFSRIIRIPNGSRDLLILAISGILFLAIFGQQVFNRLEAAITDRTRPELAYMAYKIIDDFPLGVGVNNYDQVMSDKYAHPKWVGHTLYPVHNKYLLIWSETGLHGLIAFLLLLFSATWKALRYLQRPGIADRFYIPGASLLGALAGYSFHLSTEGFGSRSNLQVFWFIIALIVAVDWLSGQAKTEATEKEPS
ncbi:MAG: O-antigen ligase family protein [Anaerolineales bacterium]|nr:O-antigen ligase family protein [Anaerolineales bacterium]